jgi:hypothetical protein
MILDYLNDKDFTVTQIACEIEKAKKLYHQLLGSVYKDVLYDEICSAVDILRGRKSIASKEEIECYETFFKYNLISKI